MCIRDSNMRCYFATNQTPVTFFAAGKNDEIRIKGITNGATGKNEIYAKFAVVGIAVGDELRIEQPAGSFGNFLQFKKMDASFQLAGKNYIAKPANLKYTPATKPTMAVLTFDKWT